MKRLKTIRITQSQGEVLMAIMGIQSLPKRTLAGYMRYKRHDRAIDQLKELRLIQKGPDNILAIHPDSSRNRISDILIENKIWIP